MTVVRHIGFDAKAHPAGRVLGENVYTLRTDNARRGLATREALNERMRVLTEQFRSQYPATAEEAL